MKNLEILKGVLSAETYALVEKETAESEIQLCVFCYNFAIIK